MTATQVQFRGGTAAQCDAMVPADREIVVDTTNVRLRVGDGVLAGGYHIVNSLDIQHRYFTYAVAGGTANAITLALAEPLDSYGGGVDVIFKATADNTSAVTFNIDGLGTITGKKMVDGSLTDLEAGDIRNGGLYQIVGDGTYVQLMNAVPPAGFPDAITGDLASQNSVVLTVDFSTYSAYDIIIDGADSGNNDPDIVVDVSSNGGSSYATASRYSKRASSSNAWSTSGVNEEIYSLDTPAFVWGTIMQASTSDKTVFMYNTITAQSSNYVQIGATSYATTAAVNRIRIQTSSGAMQAGKIILQPKATR